MFDSPKLRIRTRKNRTRKVPLVRLFLFGLAAALLYNGLGGIARNAKRPRPDVQVANFIPIDPQARITEPLERCIDRLTHVVKPGDTFLGILTGYDIAREDADACYRSLKPLGLPTLFPGDSIIVKKCPDGGVRELSLLSRMQCWYEVTNDDSLLTARKRSLRLSSYRYLVNGTLQTSLSEDLSKLGVSDAVTARFADIFAWDINFFLDPRRGDRFQILFEQKFAEGRFVGYGEILAARYRCNGKDFYAVAFRDPDGALRYYDIDGKSVQKQFLKAPLRYSRISSRFSYNRKHPVLGIVRPHLGIDYAAPRGTPVYSAADGTVQFSGQKGGFGNLVVLTHGASYETMYGHLQHFARGMGRGARIRQGDMVGTVGSTGMSTGPHLDYRMKRRGQFVNPLTISLPSCESVKPERRDEYEAVRLACLAAFSMRFAEQDGLYVFDIEQSAPDGSDTHKTVRTTSSANGNHGSAAGS